jgi:hypothetical protein
VRPQRTMSRVYALAAASLLALGLTGVALAASGSTHKATVSKVTVTFSDTSLRASPTTPGSGPTTFVVLNKGKKAHVLVVRGPGVKGARTGKVAAGGVGRLTVTLRPGAYVLSDPVGLGEYNVMFLDVLKSAVVNGKGNGNVVAPEVELPPMCGLYYTP